MQEADPQRVSEEDPDAVDDDCREEEPEGKAFPGIGNRCEEDDTNVKIADDKHSRMIQAGEEETNRG